MKSVHTFILQNKGILLANFPYFRNRLVISSVDLENKVMEIELWKFHTVNRIEVDPKFDLDTFRAIPRDHWNMGDVEQEKSIEHFGIKYEIESLSMSALEPNYIDGDCHCCSAFSNDYYEGKCEA